MTECFPSPPPFNRFGNKRLSSENFYSDDIVDLPHSKNPFKRQRNCDTDNATMSSEERRFTQTHDTETPKSSRLESNVDVDESRTRSMPMKARTSIRNQGSDNNSTESYRAALLAEFQISLVQRDDIIASLRSSVQYQETVLLQSQAARGVCEEENRILKRAVAIQDGRQKELQGQNQQMQSVLLQAADHITNLERTNRELRIQLESNRGQYSFHSFERPPDVF